MKQYAFELLENRHPHRLFVQPCKCQAFGCDTDLSKEQQFYRETVQTDQQLAPSFNYFCKRCGEKARRNLKFY